MQGVIGPAKESVAEKRFRNHIKQFWQYLSEVELNGNEKLRDEYFLSMKHGLPRSQAEWILNDMKSQFSRAPDRLVA